MCIKGPKRTNSDTITNINKHSIIKDNLKSETQSEKKKVRVQQAQTGSFHKAENISSELLINPSTISIKQILPRRNNMESSTNIPSKTNSACSTTNCANVVTIPVPIVHNEGTFYYITVKGSLHDRSCSVFGLNDAEIQAISKRFENGVKPVMNGVMIGVPPMDMVNTLSQLSYKVVCSSGEAEICWTMQREV